MDMVQNVRTYIDIECVYELTLALIQYGADPNIVLNGKATSGSAIVISEITNFGEMMRCAPSDGSNDPDGQRENFRGSFRTHSRYILFYYIILITKKEFILADPQVRYARIIYMLYYTMAHEPLYNCLKSLHNFYVAQVPNKTTEHLITLITMLYKKPRTLKQLARARIYESLRRKLAPNINRLNLPGPLKEYVLNFET